MPRAVIFDVDGVLIDSLEANLKFVQDVAAYGRHSIPTRKECENLFHLTLWDILRRVIPLASDEEIGKLQEIGRSRAVPYPIPLLKYPKGLEKGIRELEKKYLLAIATSRGHSGVFEPPELGKLREYFKAVAANEDTKEHKPHPAPLLFAAGRLGVSPEECVYVGDAETDIIAARAAGMKVILFSEKEIEGADRRTSRFGDLPELIGRL